MTQTRGEHAEQQAFSSFLSPFSSPMRPGKPTRKALLGWIVPLALLLAVGVLGAVRGGRAGSDIVWLDDYVQALALARQTRRPLLIQFQTPGCVWCAKMDAETFASPDVIDLSRRFVCLRLDDAENAALCAHYGILEYPTTLFADTEGRAVGRLVGYIPPARFAQAERPPPASASSP